MYYKKLYFLLRSFHINNFYIFPHDFYRYLHILAGIYKLSSLFDSLFFCFVPCKTPSILFFRILLFLYLLKSPVLAAAPDIIYYFICTRAFLLFYYLLTKLLILFLGITYIFLFYKVTLEYLLYFSYETHVAYY